MLRRGRLASIPLLGWAALAVACSQPANEAASPRRGPDASLEAGGGGGAPGDAGERLDGSVRDALADASLGEAGPDASDASTEPDAAPLPAVTSSTRGWVDIAGTRPSYEYGPAIIREGSTYYAFYCSDPTVTGWDTIRMSTSQDGSSWSAPVDALVPGGAYDLDSACDPTVVKFRGVYWMYYTCINTTSSPDGYHNNRVCVAVSDDVSGPYRKYERPVVEDLGCPSDWNASYCVGQPSAVVADARVYLYYTNAYPGDPGPAPGDIHLATSTDGVQFQPANGGAPVWNHRDVDVKRDRRSGLFLMVQGEVDTKQIVWTASSDGVHWLPYDPSRSIAFNTSMPADGRNHNPGLAGDALGHFDGMTFVMYGSSYESGWGKWHLYRSDIVVEPAENDCSQCAEDSCDWACSKTLASEQVGHCAHPGSAEVGKCCACAAAPAESDCAACAPGGCVVACRAGGHSIGACSVPGSKDPAACCACY
ncbi:MAG: hypothetical protein OZ921_07705 [Sorangiineae bacterium]|nr:hypothetical protein [Polyangiaceae bacterium]MEB2322381.1 hypothetical protein [Sorangiineae bacterium]